MPHTPPFPVSIALGDRRRIARLQVEPGATVADLAASLGAAPSELAVDGHPVTADQVLTAGTVAPGSHIEVGGARSDRSIPTGVHEVVVCGGLHSGLRFPIGAAGVVVGRGADASARIPCPTLSPHHARVEGTAGGHRVVDLDSTNGTVPSSSGSDASTGRDRGFRAGAVRFRIEARSDDGSGLGPPDPRGLGPPDPRGLGPPDPRGLGPPDPLDGRQLYDRPPRPPAEAPPTPISVPPPPATLAGHSPFSWALFLCPLVIGGVLAVLISPLMAAFAFLSPVMMIASWYESRRRARRGDRTEQRSYRRAVEDLERSLGVQAASAARVLHAAHPDPARTADAAIRPDGALWVRRPDHPRWLHLRLGVGPVPFAPVVTESRFADDVSPALCRDRILEDAPVTIDACCTRVVGIAGPTTTIGAVGRALVVDAVVDHGPADLALLVDMRDPDGWGWSTWVPHLVDEHGESGGRHLLVVTDRVGALRPGTAARLALDARGEGSTIVVLAPASASLPEQCGAIVEVTHPCGDARVTTVATGRTIDRVHLDGVPAEVADAVARALARLRDPEDTRGAGGLPDQVPLLELVGEIDADTMDARWATAGGGAATPIGIDRGGVHVVDLVADGPHVLIGGTTGSGKSELLRTLVAGLAARHPPDDLTFVLIDYKGGAAFDACASLPHTLGVVTDLDEQLGSRAIRSLDAEIRRREGLLRSMGVADLAGYRDGLEREPSLPALPRLVIVVDEFAALAKDCPTVLEALVDVAQRGRSLGLHLVLATQRPAGIVSDHIRTNVGLRLALRVADPTDSIDVIGAPGAASLPRGAAGRAITRRGEGELAEVQIALVSSRSRHRPPVVVSWCDDPPSTEEQQAEAQDEAGPTDLERIVDATRTAWARRGERAGLVLHRPWVEPLPEDVELPPSDPPGEGWALGLADDPDHQMRRPLRWQPDDGPLLLFGMPGSGCTTALRTVLLRAAEQTPSHGRHLYVIGPPAEYADLLALPHVGAVVDPSDRERRDRLLTVLGEPAPAPTLLVVDDIRTLLDAVDRDRGLHAMDELLRLLTARRADLAVAVAADRVSAMPGALSATSSCKLLLRLPDPFDYIAFGARPGDTRGWPPGRGFDVASGLEVQIARSAPPASTEAAGQAPRPDPIAVLPREVALASLTGPHHTGSDWLLLPIGCLEGPGETAAVALGPGDHLLIAGPEGSGRSTALATLAASAAAHGEIDIVVSGPPRSGLADHPSTRAWWVPAASVHDDLRSHHGRPTLVLLDDAELLDDPSGLFADLLVRDHGVHVVAAAHAERLRASYGHWTAPLRLARFGLALCPGAYDGELWATALDPCGSTPGRGRLLCHGRPTLVQVARP